MFPDAALSVPLALLLLLSSLNPFVRVPSVFLHPAVAPKRPPLSPECPLGSPLLPPQPPQRRFGVEKNPNLGPGGALSSPRSPLGCPCVPPPQLSEGRDALKKTWNPKFTLRSHYDAVRGLAFHPAEAALLTASEDGTLKLWNLQKTVAAKKWVLGIPGGGLVSPHPLQVWTCPPFCAFYYFFGVFPPAGTRRWTWSRSTPSAGTGGGWRHPEEIGTPRGELWGPP